MYKNKRFTLKGLVEGVPNIADKGKIIEQEDAVQLLNNQDERIQELLSCNHGLAQKQIRMFNKLIQLEKENKDLRCTIESNSQDDYIDYYEITKHFMFIYKWLSDNHLLSEKGTINVLKSLSISTSDLTEDGNKFMYNYYYKYLDNIVSSIDDIINDDINLLNNLYNEFKNNK